MTIAMLGKFVLVRTERAGVHMGTLVSQNGREVLLKDTSRLWRWRGAKSLSEVSQNGVAAEWTRISERAPENLLLTAVEVLPCSAKAQETFTPRWPA